MDLVSAGLAVAQTGLSLFGASAEKAAKKQDYLNQTAYQDATSQFNQWQAGQNRKLSDANSQYKYWADTVQYNQSLAYTNQLRTFELAKEIAQAERVGQTRAAAAGSFVVNAEALQQQMAEQGMQEAVAMQQYQYRMLQQSASFQAGNQEGQTADRFVRDTARQMGDYQTLMTINQGLKNRQYRREQLGQVTEYLNQYNSQDFYQAQQYMDPIAPFAPLPSLMTPPPPSMRGAEPSGMSAMNVGTAVLGGVNTYLSTSSKVKKGTTGFTPGENYSSYLT